MQNPTHADVLGQFVYLHRLLGRHMALRGRHGRRRPDPRRGQGRVLQALSLTDRVSQKDLAYLLDMSKQGLAELLAKLESAGLITREQSEDDKRILMVRLTDAGRQAAASSADDADTDAGFLSALSDDELETLSELLGKLIERLEAESGDEDSFDARAEKMRAFIESLDDEQREAFMERRGFPGGFGPFGGFGPRGFGPRGRHGRGRGCGPRGPWDRPEHEPEDVEETQAFSEREESEF